jgi:Icc-related predicted phosphoesterase
MKVALVSDIHLEFDYIDIKNTDNADVLILSGDILIAQILHNHEPDTEYTDLQVENLEHGPLKAYHFRKFLTNCSRQFKHVVYVAGNHEFYHGKFFGSLQYIEDECAKFPNVHFLEDRSVTIGDYVFVGSTFWTDMNRGDPLTQTLITEIMNDFKVIRVDQSGYRKLRPRDVIARHNSSIKFLKETIKKNPEAKFVVVGHHLPSHRSIHPMYAHDYHGNGAYYSDLSGVILDHPQIKLWTCGHTHHRHWYHIGDTLVACNPRGYANVEQSALDFDLRYIDLDNMTMVQEVSANYSWQV